MSEDSEITTPKSFEELRRASDKGFIKRAIGAYLFPRNIESSIRRYRLMGIPLVRKVVMATAGQAPWNKKGAQNNTRGNYRLNKSLGELSSAMDFALYGSVINEAIHTGLGIMPMGSIMADIINNGNVDCPSNFGWLAANAALVGLQRYNRARMAQRIDQGLRDGKNLTRVTETGWG